MQICSHLYVLKMGKKAHVVTTVRTTKVITVRTVKPAKAKAPKQTKPKKTALPKVKLVAFLARK